MMATDGRRSPRRPDARGLVRRWGPGWLVEGVWNAFGRVERAQQRAFERRLGISTSGHAYLDEFGLANPESVFYEGCQWLPGRRALRALRPGGGDVFADLGAGKGQALLIAGALPIKRVIGVEFVPELAKAARGNVDRARPRLEARDIEVVAEDARRWDVPDDLSILFMYCPFTGRLFRDVMQRVFDAYDAHPRPLHFVYVYPWEHNWLMGTGRVRLVDVMPARWPTRPWWWRGGMVIATYRIIAAGDTSAADASVRPRLLRPRRAISRWIGPNDHHFKLFRAGEVIAETAPAAE